MLMNLTLHTINRAALLLPLCLHTIVVTPAWLHHNAMLRACPNVGLERYPPLHTTSSLPNRKALCRGYRTCSGQPLQCEAPSLVGGAGTAKEAQVYTMRVRFIIQLKT